MNDVELPKNLITADPTRRGKAIRTLSGRIMYPFDPRADEICLDDIAHSLAMLPRYTGHTIEPVSVAQHSCVVSRKVPAECALPALLHDAAEAYLNDIASPNKPAYIVYGEPLSMHEWRLLETIFVALKVPWPDASAWSDIHVADKSLYDFERGDSIRCWRPQEAKYKFLTRFKELWREPSA
jgi:hypothetical protein